MRTLVLADALDGGLAHLARSDGAVAVTFYPAEPSGARSASTFLDLSAADELDAFALSIARDWHLPAGGAFRVGASFLPHHYEVAAFLETVDLLRHLHLADRILAEVQPGSAVAAASLRPCVREAVAAACAHRGVALRWDASSPAPPAPAPSWKGRVKRTLLRARYRRKIPPRGKGPVLLWAYPKVRSSRLVEALAGEGCRFVLAGGEDPFWAKGIPCYVLRPEPTRRERWEAAFDRAPFLYAWRGIDLSGALRRTLSRLLGRRFAEAEGLARALAAYRAPVDAAVTADFIDGPGGVVHDWAESKSIPRLGIQHGAPLADYWLRLRASWTRGTLLAWSGPASADFFRSRSLGPTRVEPVGSADNDRFATGFRRSERPNLLLCTLSGLPYTTTRLSHEMNARLVADLLEGTAPFPELEVVLKPHPLQPAGERAFLARCVARAGRSRSRLADPSEPIDELLSRTRILATRFSSTAVEAGLAGIPLLHLEHGLEGHPWYTGFLRDGRVLQARDAASIRTAVEGILAGEAAASASARAFAAEWEGTDGRATERVASAILSAARAGASERSTPS